MSPSRADMVLAFWFDQANTAHWFFAHPDFDARICEQFVGDVEAAAAGKLDDWQSTPNGWLALLILLDQFPRNFYRNDARAWVHDVRAQRVALSGIAEGFDGQLPAIQRVFAYMPLEHAEDMGLQQQSVLRYGALLDLVGTEERHRFADYLDYARRHRDVIARFGRFPHRNAAMGRVDTIEEARYLAEPGAGF